jgi:hypothetical protein
MEIAQDFELASVGSTRGGLDVIKLLRSEVKGMGEFADRITIGNYFAFFDALYCTAGKSRSFGQFLLCKSAF